MRPIAQPFAKKKLEMRQMMPTARLVMNNSWGILSLEDWVID